MFPEKMRALMLESYESGRFTSTEVDVPEPANGQVLVKVHASGVNPIDTKIRQGVAPYAMPELPAILGTDLAGEVVAVGEDVDRFAPGDNVYGLTGGVTGLPGSLAEYVVVDVDLIAHKPKNLSMREAAALPLVFLTAWEGLVDHAGVKAGDTVLVQGGSGGVGHMVIQLARILGAIVYATTSSAKSTLVRELGATPIDYHKLTKDEYVAQYTGGKGFDIVYDTVGGESLQSVLTAAKHYGHITSCAAFGQFDLTASSLRCTTLSAVFVLLPMLTGKNRAHHGELLQKLTEFVEAGRLRPVVEKRRFNLDSAMEAHAAVEQSNALIKVVIDIL